MNGRLLLAAALVAGIARAAPAAEAPLEACFRDPPRDARVRAYWWWLNGHVDRAAITRDLEAMKAKGWGGALLCDAGGSDQFEAVSVPAGPRFLSDAWRELYRHAVAEADRLGLELSVNIQSGWNLGGPMVTPERAVKKLVFSKTRVTGPGPARVKLPPPESRNDYYRDIAVVACPAPAAGGAGLSASSAQNDHPVGHALDGREDTFWVSAGNAPGGGPSGWHPEWIQVDLPDAGPVDTVTFRGRPGYGPKKGEVQVSEDGKAFRAAARYEAKSDAACTVKLNGARARSVRLTCTESHDPRYPDAPRNVQIAELSVVRDGRPVSVAGGRRPIGQLEVKLAAREFGGSAPDCRGLLSEPAQGDDPPDVRHGDVVDLSDKLQPDGGLAWDAPAGAWDVLRFGYTISGAKVSTCSPGWEGLVIDYLDPDALRWYWGEVIEVLIRDAGPAVGRTLKYLHTDSWELGGTSWTPRFREEFRARRGYDLLPFLPVAAGYLVDSREISHRFLNDFRRTVGDLVADRHYGLMSSLAHERGLQIHPESGGPHAAPIDSLRLLGISDVPMSEFWARSYRHRVREEDRFFVKQPASVAHTYGRRIVAAEGFTTIGPQWEETVWDNLKPSFDHALCEGLNLLVWHAFTCSPASMGLPGQEYFAGTHFNPQSTWWETSGPFIASLNRCQALLQRGLFVADACQYYGDHVPNFARLRASDAAGVGPGRDYDVATEQVLTERMAVKDGRIVLPDGMSYRLLVLPDLPNLSVPALRTVRELVLEGATVVGRKPARATGLQDYPACDAEIGQLAAELWGDQPAEAGERRAGAGRVVWGRTAREVLEADGVPPDFAWTAGGAATDDVRRVSFIHRREGDADLYFVCNASNEAVDARCVFRVAGRAPELWFPDTGETRSAARAAATADGRTAVPLRLDPYGSVFVVFRRAGELPAEAGRTWAAADFAANASLPDRERLAEVAGPWTVSFPPGRSAPASVTLDKLVSWTEHPEPGVKFFSGTATYARTIEVRPEWLAGGARLFLDLGDLREMATVRVNGRDLGVLWKPPFAADITAAARPGTNALEIGVVNFWPNRVIGDLALPPERRITKHNSKKFKPDTPLMRSGLFGPVTLSRASGTANER